MPKILRVNEPEPEWAETYVFSVDATSDYDGPIEAVGPTYKDAAIIARAALVMRCLSLTKLFHIANKEAEELLDRANAVMERGKEIEDRWLDTK